MALRSIQSILAFLAADLRARCSAVDATGLGSWRFVGELAEQRPLADDPADEVPLVLLQAGAPQRALVGSLHPCFSYSAELVVEAQPDVAASSPASLMQALGRLEREFQAQLAALSGAPLVDPADEVAAAYLVQAYAERASTEAAEIVYLFKIPFTLVVQF